MPKSGLQAAANEIAQEPAELDQIDLSILRVLIGHGRISFADLAEKVHVSRATVYTRVSRLTHQGVIRGFTVQLDPRRLGLGIAAFVAMKVAFHEWRSVVDQLEKMPEVEHYGMISGEFDLFVLVRAQTIETIRDVVLNRLTELAGVQSTTTYFVFDEMMPRTMALPGDAGRQKASAASRG
jgi:DNA-binding Lrp family transcriptional regulator